MKKPHIIRLINWKGLGYLLGYPNRPLTKCYSSFSMIYYMINNKRKNVRFPAHARVRIPKVFEGEALLKDLSITGCGIECTMFVDVKPGAQFSMEIIPEVMSNIDKFDIQVESRWIRTGDYSCEIGFSIIASPRGKHFQRYVDYLSFRSQTE